MRVCAGLTSHEVEESCKAATSLHFVIASLAKSGPVNKRIQQNLIFKTFCLSDLVTSGVVNSHPISPRLTGA